MIELSPELRLDIQEHLIDKGLAVLGMRGSGKSYTCGVIAEELAKVGQPFVVIDPMGEYFTLRERFPILIAGLETTDYTDLAGLRPRHAPGLASRVVEKGLSLVLDLSGGTVVQQLEFIAEFLKAFYSAEKEHRRPYVLIVDEAHRIAPELGPGTTVEAPRELIQRTRRWLSEMAATGRKYGIGLVIAARRPAEVRKSVLSQTAVKIIHRLVDPADLKRLHEEGMPREYDAMVRELEPGEAVVIGLGKEPLFTKIKERLCSHGGITPSFKPIKSPDLETAIRELAEALGLAEAKPGLPIPPVGLEEEAAMVEEGPRPERPWVPRIAIPELAYPTDVVADYLARSMIYGHLEEFVPRSGQRLKRIYLSVQDAEEALNALTRALLDGGWVLRKAGEDLMLALRGEVLVGLKAALASDGPVLTLVASAPSVQSLDRALGELKALLDRACPGAKHLGQ